MNELDQESQEYFELLLDEGYSTEMARELAYKYINILNDYEENTDV